jgi:hypothetical protein
MAARYSEIRDAAFDAIAAVLTATPLGSEASHKQLGATRERLTGRAAEAVADEVAAMLANPDKYQRPRDRHEHDPRDYSEPGSYDDSTRTPPPAPKSTHSGGGGLF